jgi:hypothetical protein
MDYVALHKMHDSWHVGVTAAFSSIQESMLEFK